MLYLCGHLSYLDVYDEIRLCVQSILIILGSTMNIIGRTYVIIQRARDLEGDLLSLLQLKSNFETSGHDKL